MESDFSMISEEKSEELGKLVNGRVHNLNVLEELSRVNHIFADKTGTMTTNELVFKSIAIGEEEFILRNHERIDFKELGDEIRDYINRNEEDKDLVDRIHNLWRCICLCHNVIQVIDHRHIQVVREDLEATIAFNRKPKSIASFKVKSLEEEEEKKEKHAARHEDVDQYSGASLHELTLIEMARDVGFAQFRRRDPSSIEMKFAIETDKETYQILRDIDFTPERKRMSVIVKSNVDDKVYIFTKGADSAVLELAKRPFDYYQ